VLRLEADQTTEKMDPGSSRVKSGTITWTDDLHYVSSPIVVAIQAPLG
jgi:hypothetical protein